MRVGDRLVWYVSGRGMLTDGGIGYPRAPMPYLVLWALTLANAGFRPPYGQVIDLTGVSISSESTIDVSVRATGVVADLHLDSLIESDDA